jgi:hypothetical protein
MPLPAAFGLDVVGVEPLGNRSQAFPLVSKLKDPPDDRRGLRVRFELTLSVFAVTERDLPAGVVPLGLPWSVR